MILTPLFNLPTGMGKCANGVAHPITKESLTKYKKAIEVTELRETWIEAMFRELGRLSQRFGEIKGTDTVFFHGFGSDRKYP